MVNDTLATELQRTGKMPVVGMSLVDIFDTVDVLGLDFHSMYFYNNMIFYSPDFKVGDRVLDTLDNNQIVTVIGIHYEDQGFLLIVRGEFDKTETVYGRNAKFFTKVEEPDV